MSRPASLTEEERQAASRRLERWFADQPRRPHTSNAKVAAWLTSAVGRADPFTSTTVANIRRGEGFGRDAVDALEKFLGERLSDWMADAPTVLASKPRPFDDDSLFAVVAAEWRAVWILRKDPPAFVDAVIDATVKRLGFNKGGHGLTEEQIADALNETRTRILKAAGRPAEPVRFDAPNEFDEDPRKPLALPPAKKTRSKR